MHRLRDIASHQRIDDGEDDKPQAIETQETPIHPGGPSSSEYPSIKAYFKLSFGQVALSDFARHLHFNALQTWRMVNQTCFRSHQMPPTIEDTGSRGLSADIMRDRLLPDSYQDAVVPLARALVKL